MEVLQELAEQYHALNKYIGIAHNYGTSDCITLVKSFYREELGIDIILPEYPKSRKWLKSYSVDFMDSWVSKYTKKVSLTEAKNYDLISFKSKKSNLLTHFGLYIKPNRMLHVEEGKNSQVEQLSDYWLQYLHALYRHDKMV
jgi:cell wall-associated NlpC family hydrolase